MKRFDQYLNRLVPHMQEFFPVTVSFVNKEFLKSITKTKFPVQGLFNEREIFLLDTVSSEKQLFALIHIAGHYTQWKDLPWEKEYSFSFQQEGGLKSDIEILKHYQHEIESIEYSLDFLHKQGVTDLDVWFKELFKKDQEEINNYFRSNRLEESIGELDKNFIYVL